MSDLRPTGTPVVVEGEERHLLFTLNAIDELQESFDLDLGQIVDNLTDKQLSSDTLRKMLTILLNDEAEREALKGNELKRYTVKEIGWVLTLDNQLEYALAILKAYGLSLPEAEENDPNRMGGQTEE